MLNKFFKTIHNKFSKYLRFIFFLRYLFTISFIFFIIFLSIPNFFNYEKRAETIKNHLLKNYDLKINKYEKIRFRFFPSPRLEITNSTINFNKTSTRIETNTLKIFPKFYSLYNFENFKIKKIVLKNNSTTVDISILYDLIKKFHKQKKKFSLENLTIYLVDKNESILKLDNIKFTNYGYNENIITGKIFDKKFKIDSDNEFKKINFKIINSGIGASINFNEIRNEIIKGDFKAKILNTNLKFSFNFDNKILNIDNFYLRNKNLSFEKESSIIFLPYLYINSKFYVEELNVKILKNVQFDKLIEFKDIIKKINSKNEIIFKSNKLSRNLIDRLNLKIDLAYGRINYSKKFLIDESNIRCAGSVNLLEESPLLFFNCSIISKDKHKLFKKFSIKTKKGKNINLNIEGNINVLNNKINFKDAKVNDDYLASKNDLKYFKEIFEGIFLKDNFLEIFNLKKIKEFVSEIS